ncbi:class I SAM-dependent methyltransferase [Nocardia implantans]|uniref:Class I SAM-dependent methyltransferase n=1 Tax=Nocardia implantans TaxID=3108168 RepID=A0ABU6B3T6_9NOCA|nr:MULTISPECIES: class I SAM-dependent methyltransferase [unclassified Nocardia]MBF6196016.1 class I SAM-dependent methyltransferase [Nocardia beijingensis]MEA3532250.1 class I SAM-dependent methyltransferase [Nocardia sp. CDC192]MEB3514356.1 class I SAM-dependent methyltransferase [Nocardia sp. CDC186]
MTVLLDKTKRYNPIDSWFYDNFISDAVREMTPTLFDDIVAQLDDGAQVLDVGCGGGQLAVGLATTGTTLRLTGIDLSPQQVRRARKRGAPLGSRIQFREGSAMDLPFPDAAYDAVISSGSIKHWPNQRKGLSEMIRVLRPGGLLLVIEADRGCTFEDARAFVDRWKLPQPMARACLPFFRTYIAGYGIDLEDGRELVADLPVTDATVRRIAGEPGIQITARKLDE